MSIIFNAEEIFDLAIQIEKNGAAFYKKAAENTENSQVKEKLNNLAEMETDHEKAFEKMRNELCKPEKGQTVFDPYDELEQYLKAFAEGHVFDLSDPSKNLIGNESPVDILKTAIGLEKDSIVFYLGIKELVPKEFGRDKIDEIIAEEMGHIQLLSGQMEELK